MMEVACVCMAVATMVLSIVTAVVVSTVPLLWSRQLKTEADLKGLDDVLSKLLDGMGVPKE